MGELFGIGAHGRGHFGDLLLAVRQELVQRRIEQADGDRAAVHDLEQLDEVGALHRQQLVERGAARLLVVGEDHLAHRLDAALVEEHVLGAAQPDALGAEAHGGLGVGRRVGIGAHAELAHLVGPGDERGELAGKLRLDHVDLAGQHLAGGAVDGDEVALFEGLAAGGHAAVGVIDADRAGAGNAGLAHAARDHGGVRGHAAARREDALGGVHAVDIFRRGFDPHQDDLLALGLQLGGFVGREHDLAGGGAGRSRQAGGDHLAMRARVDGRMQELVERQADRRAAPPLPC